MSSRAWFYCFALSLNIGLFAMMMVMKADVFALAERRQELHRQNLALREDLRVLEAEYAHLSNPVRLAKFAESMGLVRLQMKQVMPWKLEKGRFISLEVANARY